MRPSEEFAKVVRVARLCCMACGADVVDRNYKVNVVTYLVIFCITVYFIFSVYTVQHKVAENWTVVLEAFCMVGSVLQVGGALCIEHPVLQLKFQGISKLVSAVLFKGIMRSLCRFMEATYVAYETQGTDYVGTLRKSLSRVRIMVRSIVGLYTVVVLILISTPLAIWAVTGRRLFVMQFYIPFMDPSTIHGYLITLSMQSTCLFFGAFGNFAGDLFVLVTFEHSTLVVDIFELKIEELNKRAVNFGSPEVDQQLKNVIVWHQGFVKEIDSMYYWITFTQVTTSGLSIVLTLVIMFTGDWPGSYAYICISFAMLYLYCWMGTLVEIANERLLEKVYDINWYSMTISQQKAVRFMLMRAQSMQPISVGGVVPLSVSTGLQVTKTVYSVFMMLLNMFD